MREEMRELAKDAMVFMVVFALVVLPVEAASTTDPSKLSISPLPGLTCDIRPCPCRCSDPKGCGTCTCIVCRWDW